MQKQGVLENIRTTVLIGYLSLFILSVYGGYRIYSELVSFTKNNNQTSTNQELNLVSNSLVTMYKAESIKKLMLSDNSDTRQFESAYRAANQAIHASLDSLRHISNEPELDASIDTINVLLAEKDKNLQSIKTLQDAIRTLPLSQQMTTSILSNKDIDKLHNIVDRNIRTEIVDSSYIKNKKKNFIGRLKDVFVAGSDSIKVISKQSLTSKDSTLSSPAKLLTDTIVRIIKAVNLKSDKKKVYYISMLTQNYREMMDYDESLTNQIHQILHSLERKEREHVASREVERKLAIKKSSRTLSVIAWASILIIIIFIIATLILINKSKTYKNNLEMSKKHAEDLMKSRERLLLMISHDIKSPLSSILGHIELISNSQMPASDKNHLNNMKHSSEHILELVNKLMDYHKLEQGKSEVNNMEFSPGQLFDNIFESFVPIAGKRLQFTLRNNINTSDSYFSDPFILKQIINNLVSNALKFTTKGEVMLRAAIDKKNRLILSVKDTGKGIKPEDIDKIFDEFQRVGNAKDKNNTDGFGLGLSITYKLVQLLQGTIEVESEPGKGSEFNIKIPLQPIDKKAGKQNDGNLATQNAKTSALQNVNILFVDDDPLLLNVYEKLLQREGATVDICSDSTKALSMTENKRYDIIFTDIQMPRMNGFELVKNIRAINTDYHKEVIIIALSARSDMDENSLKAAGFDDFIVKPIKFNELIEKTRSYLNHNNMSSTSETAIKGFDSLIEFLEDDTEAAKEILDTFRSENEIKLNELTDGIKNGNWEQIRMTSHKLLPLMKMIGKDDMTPLLEQLERGEKNRQCVDDVIGKLSKVNSELDSFIANKL